MTETTQEERDEIEDRLLGYLADSLITENHDLRVDAIYRLLHDADCLAAIERDILNLADEEMEAARYEKTVNPDRAYRQRCRARRLRAIIDAGGEG